MKIFKHIIKGILWSAVGLYVLIITLIHVPAVQRYIGERTACLLSEKLGTEVRIGKVDPGFLNRIILDDVLIYDRQHKKMMTAARISAKIDILPLFENRISISSIQIFGTHFCLYRASGKAQTNFQFIIDSLASRKDNSEKTPLDLRINTFIMQHSSISFDCYDVPPTNRKFNKAHLKVTDISAHISLKAFNEDSLNVIVKKIAFNEQSGLQLTRLSFKAEGNRQRGRLYDFCMKMPDTEINMGNITATYKLNGNGLVPGTLTYTGDIGKSGITPSDFSALFAPLRYFHDAVTLESGFNGTDEGIRISGLKVSSGTKELSIDADGWIRKQTTGTPRWAVNVNDIFLSHDFTDLLCRNIKDAGGDIPDFITRLGNIQIRGNAESDGRAINSNCELNIHNAGSISIDLSMPGSKYDFTGRIHTAGIDLGTILDNANLGTVATDININGTMPGGIKPDINADGTVTMLEYNNYTYRDISVHGSYADKSVTADIKMTDRNVSFEAEGTVRKKGNASDIKVKASVNDFSPANTRLTDRWGDARFNAYIDADFTASGLNDATGFISVTGLSMVSSRNDYSLDRIDIKSGYDDEGIHYLTMNSDFGDAMIVGSLEYNTLAQSMTNIIKKRLPTMPGLKSTTKANHNCFTVNARIDDTEWMERFFNIPLLIDSPLVLKGRLDDNSHELSVSCDVPYFRYDGKEYRYGEIDITTLGDTLQSCIGVTKIMDNGSNLELRITGNAAGNNLSTSFSWDNNARKRMSGVLNAKTRFFLDDDEKAVARIDIQPSHIGMNNSIWDIQPSSITYTKGNVDVENFAIVNKEQHIIINGTSSAEPSDTLSVDLKDIDIEYILGLVNFHAVDFSGKATGRAFLAAPFGEMSAVGKLTVNDFKFENGRMGTLDADVGWDKDDKQINISATAIDGPETRTIISGYVSPSRNYIDLGIQADGTNIEFLQSFTSSFTDYIDGKAQGKVTLAGPLSEINLTGELIVSGETTISPTNCKYFLRNDTITFIPNEIKLNNAAFHDTRNRTGTIGGSIYHNHLTNLSYDLSVKADNLLAYNFRDFGDDSFYGTVYGSGEVGIHGRSGEVNININITPQKNSSFVYNASNPDAISNQEFINWNDATDTGGQEESIPERSVSTNVNIPTDMHINLLINCTPDATVKILMDNKTNDYITLNGHGTIRAAYYNKGAFNMFGTYVVERGTYGITIQDIIKKNFVFNEGGTIVFGGDPYDANLNLQAIYTVNGVSLSDLNIGKSFSNNTIRVNCLMNIGGQPKAPQVDFDLDMPTVSSDEKQMIRSVINSEDEMNQQVVYLLGIGRFYPQEANNSAAQNENQQNQMSLAMQSLLSGTISSQINSVLNTVINSNNWNFGANISTGDEGWNNAEYEGLLSGRLLNNRLLINGQFGYRDNVNATSSFIGDFDIRYLLHPNGNLAINIYNKTNDRYFTKSSLNTQGIGLIMKKDFNGLGDLFGIRSKKKRNKKKE